MKLLMQAVAYAVFAIVVAVLSVKPAVRLLASDEAVVSLSFSHSAKRVGECRRLTQEELLALPPNMRKPDDCPRQRHPLLVEFEIDGEVAYRASLPPSGLWEDGKATVYERLRIPSGTHAFSIRINDSGRADAFDFERSKTLQVTEGQNVVVYFDNATQRFEIE